MNLFCGGAQFFTDLKKGLSIRMLPRPEIDRLVKNGNLLFNGKPDDIRSPAEFRAQDILRVEADQPRDKEMIDLICQRWLAWVTRSFIGRQLSSK